MELVGIGFTWKHGQATYLPFPRGFDNQIELIEKFRNILEDPTVGKMGQNLKYDSRILDRFNIRIQNISFDTMLAHYCLFGDRFKHNLDDICMHHLGHIKVRTKDVIPRKTKTNSNPTMADTDPAIVAHYCCEDTDFTFRVVEYLRYLLKQEEHSAAKEIYYKFELPLLPVLIDMECSGVVIDTDYIDNLREEVHEEIEHCSNVMEQELGERISITNSRAIEKAVYETLSVHRKMGLTIGQTKTGRFKTDAATLQTMKRNRFVNNLLRVKKLNKLLNTYVDAIPNRISDVTDLLHASFNQTITATGRLSSSGPNLQNIPKGDPTASKVRNAFISRFTGGCILAADYSQCELRILADLTQEPTFINAFNSNLDIHSNVASVIYNIPIVEITELQRRLAKTANFLLIYGGGEMRLASTLSIKVEAAREVISKYLGGLPKIKEFMDESAQILDYFGYTETMFGRRRYISEIYSKNIELKKKAEREGMNHRIQGSNADLIKLAMIAIHSMLENKQLKSKLVLQIHDEIVIDVHPDEKAFLKEDVLDIMQNVVHFSIPMVAEGEYADSWGEAH